MVDLKILQSDWLRAFWPISQEKDFPKHSICAGTQQILYNKLWNKFSEISDPSPQFLGQKKFFQKIWLCHPQLDKGFQHNVKIQKNLMII